MIDLYGNVMTTDTRSMLFVSVSEQSTAALQQGQKNKFIYTNNIAGTFYTAQSGMFIVDSLVLSTTPNTTQILEFKTNDIDFTNDFNKGNTSNSIIKMTVEVRSCWPGEEITLRGE